MQTDVRTRVAVVGGGPIGLEAALYARTLGHPVTVFEAGRVGEHLRRWGHVSLFTPWRLNASALGRRRLAETGHPLAVDEAACPTGEELVRQYLEPLARLSELAESVREGTRVAGISRGPLLKGDGVTDGTRAARPFRLLVERDGRESVAEAEVVIDATGIYGRPNPLGAGGVPALGERSATGVATGLPHVTGTERSRYEGKRVLVVGGGLSAATTVVALSEVPGTRVIWATRGPAPPIHRICDDPLPARAALADQANALVENGAGPVEHRQTSGVERIEQAADGTFTVFFADDAHHPVEVDRIIAQTGFRPDTTFHQELQIHLCYASEGPMKLAAALLGTEGGDCMTQTGFGPESLTSPEPGYFIVGHKSYGRGSEFLLRIGREQVRDVFRLIHRDPELDLYRNPAHA